MESIKINNRELQYEICTWDGEYSYHYYTKFYEGTFTEKRKKYYLFGPEISVTRPKFIFDLNKDISSASFSKKECKVAIIKKLADYDLKSKRTAEIKNGNIV